MNLKKISTKALLPIVMTMPVMAMAADLDPTALVSGISKADDIMIAVGTAIFSLVGIVVAFQYGKRMAK